MRFSSAISSESDLTTACRDAAQRARRDLGDGAVDFCAVFASPAYGNLAITPALLAEELDPRTLVGCCGGGIIGGQLEVEGRPALSVTLGSLPGARLHTLHIEEGDLPDADAPPSAWIERIGVTPADTSGFLLLPEPFSFPADRLLAGLDYAYPDAPKAGGLVSGHRNPNQHWLFRDRTAYRSGCVLVALGGALGMDTRVAQGCKPFGRVGRITKASAQSLEQIDGKPAGQFLQEQLITLQGGDRELAQTTPLFLGIAMDPFAVAAPQSGDFLIRNVLDYDATSGTLHIGDHLSVGRAVQFHLRDRASSASDLRNVLSRPGASTHAPVGALLFSCLGRGQHMYGEEGHDSGVLFDLLGPIPLGGFFCNGEIGPVQGTTHLHGYTSVVALLGARSE